MKWISSHSWNLSSYNGLIHENWRYAIFEFISTFLKPPTSKELHKVSFLNLGVKLFQVKDVCILCNSSISCFENEVINVKYTILDNANVLKIIILPSTVIFLILHKFKTYCILMMLFAKFCCVFKFWLKEKCTPRFFLDFYF